MFAQGYRDIVTAEDRAEALALLQAAGLDLPDGISRGLGFHEDGRLVATVFLAGNVLCGVCVDPAHRGRGLAASLVGRLLTEALQAGTARLALFTKAGEAETFASLGFHLVAASAQAALLEYGAPDCAAWLRSTRAALESRWPGVTGGTGGLGAVVMNANPFTLGHRALVEEAVRHCGRVVVFVVEEEASAFPFADRLRLVRQGLADLQDVLVLPAGPYMVSRASFPAYFTGRAAHAAVHAGLDAQIFASRIAPALGIAVRVVGQEPCCPATAAYNQALGQVLPAQGVTLREIPRAGHAGGIISASTVREILRDPAYVQRVGELQTLVPVTTLEFLLSERGQAIAAALRARTGRH